jgi:hypothetical protein
MTGSRPLRIALVLLAAGAVLRAQSALAIDTMAPSPTYYEQELAGGTLADMESSTGGLPAELYVLDAAGGVEYREMQTDGNETHWVVHLELAERAHERVDAVYDLVLALPLPETFAAKQWGITVQEGSEGKSVPFVYGSEKVTLKRNVGLEKSWLPALVGGPNGLPDLSGTGYVLTLWDAILRYDPGRGPNLQAIASFPYAAPVGVAAPDPADESFAAYLITWIPTLSPTVRPYTIRLDVLPPGTP